MRMNLLTGPLLILAVQVPPVDVQQTSTGRVRVSVGYGTGQYVDRAFSCSADLISATPVPYQTYGAQVDYWRSQRWRVSGFGGATSRAREGAMGSMEVSSRWFGQRSGWLLRGGARSLLRRIEHRGTLRRALPRLGRKREKLGDGIRCPQ